MMRIGCWLAIVMQRYCRAISVAESLLYRRRTRGCGLSVTDVYSIERG